MEVCRQQGHTCGLSVSRAFDIWFCLGFDFFFLLTCFIPSISIFWWRTWGGSQQRNATKFLSEQKENVFFINTQCFFWISSIHTNYQSLWHKRRAGWLPTCMKAKSVIEEQFWGISVATPFARASRPLLATSHTFWSSSVLDLCKHTHIVHTHCVC